jgi:hypothetical protein
VLQQSGRQSFGSDSRYPEFRSSVYQPSQSSSTGMKNGVGNMILLLCPGTCTTDWLAFSTPALAMVSTVCTGLKSLFFILLAPTSCHFLKEKPLTSTRLIGPTNKRIKDLKPCTGQTYNLESQSKLF